MQISIFGLDPVKILITLVLAFILLGPRGMVNEAQRIGRVIRFFRIQFNEIYAGAENTLQKGSQTAREGRNILNQFLRL